MAYKRPHDDDDLDTGAPNEFAQMLEDSLKKPSRKLKQGDKVRCEILSIGKEFTIVTTGTPNDGFVSSALLMDEKGQPKHKVGDQIELYLTHMRGTELFLSPQRTAKNLSDDLGEAYQKGLTVEGRIESLTNGGVRVAMLGKSAFCPISQIDTKRVENAEEYIGKKFEFLITQYSEGGRNVVVSRRRVLEQHQGQAQATFQSERKPGDIISGTVTRFEKFGAFIEIAPGMEGLAHISELSWSRVNEASEVLELGQAVSAKILKMEREGDRLKISLSLKQSEMEPWQNLPADIEAGRTVSGKVTKCMKFGAFVEIYPGIEGLIPLSEMSYTKRVAKSDELVKEGERISVLIKEVNLQAKRISLSLRDTGTDPWAMASEKYPPGTLVQGKVERKEVFGLLIQLEEGVVGLLPKSKALESSTLHFDKLRPGDTVAIRVSEVRIDERRISLDLPDSSGSEDWKTYAAAKAAPSSVGGLMASQLQAALDRAEKKKKP